MALPTGGPSLIALPDRARDAALDQRVMAEWTQPHPLVEALAAQLSQRGLTLATVESCTGGLLGQMITARAGASSFYLGGLITYDDRVKSKLAGVPPQLVRTHGAVSREVARAMAEGGRQRLGASLTVAVTGVAGPGGGTETKPVGLTFVGLAWGAPGPGSAAFRRDFWGDREGNRRLATVAALEAVLQVVAAMD
ncbi:MAG: CinA family protein [Candidatus Dormibacteria bacterium]